MPYYPYLSLQDDVGRTLIPKWRFSPTAGGE